MNTMQANKKKTDPNIAQKLPIDAMMNPTAEMTNKTHAINVIV
jgi:hypothetical protein